jgi:hypothetical protein
LRHEESTATEQGILAGPSERRARARSDPG